MRISKNVLNQVFLTSIIVLSTVTAKPGNAQAENQWRNPFPETADSMTLNADTLTLENALRLVAWGNPSIKANYWRLEATEGLTRQAGLRPNPEFDLEAEELGGDLPGLKESEITAQMSQEIELWGKRKKRKQVAMNDKSKAVLEAAITRYDIYAETKKRYYELVHAQRMVELANKATILAESITESARTRVEKGAALFSELLLGQLELERARLQLSLSETELVNARDNLSALWNKRNTRLAVEEPKQRPVSLPDIVSLEELISGSRDVAMLEKEAARSGALLNLEMSNSKPNLTLSGGYKRIRSEGINTFLIGVGVPLPLFDRNQGNISSLRAESKAIKLAKEQAAANTKAKLHTVYRTVSQLLANYDSLDKLILPKAEEAYFSIKQAYEYGKIPYTSLLESERSLIDLRFELNDLELEIRHGIIELESLLGIKLE